MQLYNFNKAINEAFDFNNISDTNSHSILSNMSDDTVRRGSNIKATVIDEI